MDVESEPESEPETGRSEESMDVVDDLTTNFPPIPSRQKRQKPQQSTTHAAPPTPSTRSLPAIRTTSRGRQITPKSLYASG